MAADRVEEIATLLDQAGQAHHNYEQNQLHGTPDTDWPRWYAGYVVEQGISALLGHAITVDALAKFFIDIDAEFQRTRQTESWSGYVARRMPEAL